MLTYRTKQQNRQVKNQQAKNQKPKNQNQNQIKINTILMYVINIPKTKNTQVKQ